MAVENGRGLAVKPVTSFIQLQTCHGEGGNSEVLLPRERKREMAAGGDDPSLKNVASGWLRKAGSLFRGHSALQGKLVRHEGRIASAVPETNQKTVCCDECGHVQSVSPSAQSTQCGRCSEYINLRHYEIGELSSVNIKTQGNILVTRKGSLRDCEIFCDHLVTLGEVFCALECIGDATFKNSGKILGHLQCRTLRVDRGSHLQLPQGAVVEAAEIHGTVSGNVECLGTFSIFKTGSVRGDIAAGEVAIMDGGSHCGRRVTRLKEERNQGERTAREPHGSMGTESNLLSGDQGAN